VLAYELLFTDDTKESLKGDDYSFGEGFVTFTLAKSISPLRKVGSFPVDVVRHVKAVDYGARPSNRDIGSLRVTLTDGTVHVVGADDYSFRDSFLTLSILLPGATWEKVASFASKEVKAVRLAEAARLPK
jgi:hypothetical protein